MKTILVAAAIVVGVAIQASSAASTTRFQEIQWDDLVPEEAQFDDVFTRLTDDQLYALTIVAQVRDRIEAGETLDAETKQLYQEMLDSLWAQEVEVDKLLGMREAVTRERIAKTYLARQDLDGKPIRMPGYLLPLEFDGKRVTEFLLVPYVGACIHTPPPPPNQIVHVTTESGFEIGGGLYTPVWVNGLLRTEQVSSSLNYVDGTSDIPSAYRLNAVAVEPYE